MLRFYFLILTSIFEIIFYIMMARYMCRHREKYTEQEQYRLAQKLSGRIAKKGRIDTVVTGLENLPQEGGYIMFPNHQGKFDTVGMMIAHDKPLTIVMDAQRSTMPIANEFMELLDGYRLDKNDMRSQVETIMKIAKDVAEKDRRVILFPEGGYDHNRNSLTTFLPGAFKSAMKAKCPIVPVVLIDSYKPFELNSIKRVTTQLHFLPPINFDEYQGMKSQEIAELVRSRICDKMVAICGEEEVLGATN